MASAGLTSLIFGDLKCRMFIPKALGGKVVGTKGATISNLQIESQTKLITALKGSEDSLWVCIVIVGNPDKVQLAYDSIAATVDNEVDNVILDFQVRPPPSLHNLTLILTVIPTPPIRASQVHRKMHQHLYSLKSGKLLQRHVFSISAQVHTRTHSTHTHTHKNSLQKETHPLIYQRPRYI